MSLSDISLISFYCLIMMIRWFCHAALYSAINLDTYNKGFILNGLPENSATGFATHWVGDVNADGYEDYIIQSKQQCLLVYGTYNSLNVDLESSTNVVKFTVSADEQIYFGNCGGIGDINDDGYNDIIFNTLNTTLNNNVVINFYIIYGSSRLSSISFNSQIQYSLSFNTSIEVGDDDTQPHYYAYSSNPNNDNFHVSMNTAGDFNGDGIDDLLIGIGFSHVSFIVYGSKDIMSGINLSGIGVTKGYIIHGPSSSSNFGSQCSTAGDFNNDGLDDILVGCSECIDYAGSAYLIYGSRNSSGSLSVLRMTSMDGFVINGIGSDNLGYSLGSAGRFNSDQYSDIVIGSTGVNDIGASYVIYGTSNYKGVLSTLNIVSLTSTYGIAIYGAQESFAPFAVGEVGAAYLILGGNSLNNIDVVDSNYCIQLVGAKLNSLTGQSVTMIGDINRDGYADILISAPGISSKSGSSYVVLGASDFTGPIPLNGLSSISFVQLNASILPQPTTALVSVLPGDFNGDSFVDILVAVEQQSNAFIIYGASTGIPPFPSLYDITYEYGIKFYFELDENITSISGVGDINHDDLADIAIATDLGNVYIVYGNYFQDYQISHITLYQGFTWGMTISGPAQFYAVSSIGDFNKDGYDDMILGSSNSTSDVIGYIVLGSSALLATTFRVESIATSAIHAPNASRGLSVGSAGDFNNDGYSDGLICATSNSSGIDFPYYQPQISSYCFILYGGHWLQSDYYISPYDYNNNNGSTIITGLIGCQSSPLAAQDTYDDYISMSTTDCTISINGVYDVNGDGYADIAVGDPFANNEAGITYVIFGSKSPPTMISVSGGDCKFLGGCIYVDGGTQYYSGFSVNRAGDINQDGFPDIIIGAPLCEFNSGCAFIIYGGKSLASSDVITLSSSLATQTGFQLYGINFNHIGYSVDSVSDSLGNILLVLGSYNPSFLSAEYTSICVVQLTRVYPTIDTPSPSGIPTLAPTPTPTLNPSFTPTFTPTTIPSIKPTSSPTPSPFWAKNEAIVLGVGVPAVISFVPLFFSRQICFWVLDNWNSVAVKNRGCTKIIVHRLCKKIFLNDYAERIEAKKTHKEAIEDLRASASTKEGIELMELGSALSVANPIVKKPTKPIVKKPLVDVHQTYLIHSIVYENPLFNDLYNKRINVNEFKYLLQFQQQHQQHQQIQPDFTLTDNTEHDKGQILNKIVMKHPALAAEYSVMSNSHQLLYAIIKLRKILIESLPFYWILLYRLYPGLGDWLFQPQGRNEEYVKRILSYITSNNFVFSIHMISNIAIIFCSPTLLVNAAMISCFLRTVSDGVVIHGGSYLLNNNNNKQIALIDNKQPMTGFNYYHVLAYCSKALFIYTFPSVISHIAAMLILPHTAFVDSSLFTRINYAEFDWKYYGWDGYSFSQQWVNK
eukprot:gene4903-6864_t